MQRRCPHAKAVPTCKGSAHMQKAVPTCKSCAHMQKLCQHACRLLGWGARHPEVTALVAQDAALSKALQSSRRVGNLLLKEEGEELKRVGQLTEELVRKHRCVAMHLREIACLLG